MSTVFDKDKWKTSGKITKLEYLEWHTKHETDCLMNQEGS